MSNLGPALFIRKVKLKICLIVLLSISGIAIGGQQSAISKKVLLDENLLTEGFQKPEVSESHSAETVSITQNEKAPLEGEVSVVRSLVIDGNESFSEQQIRALMRTDVWGVYNETVLKSDLEAITRFYRENGYRFARVDEEQLSVKKFVDGVYLAIEVDEGRVGNIIVTGNIQTKEDVIRRELLFMEGDIYTEADREESEQILRRKTYIGAAKVDAQWDDRSKSVAIHVTIRNSYPFHLGEI